MSAVQREGEPWRLSDRIGGSIHVMTHISLQNTQTQKLTNSRKLPEHDLSVHILSPQNHDDSSLFPPCFPSRNSRDHSVVEGIREMFHAARGSSFDWRRCGCRNNSLRDVGFSPSR